jgi:hypothetical protein
VKGGIGWYAAVRIRGEREVHHIVRVGDGWERRRALRGEEWEGVRIRGIGLPFGGSITNSDSGRVEAGCRVCRECRSTHRCIVRRRVDDSFHMMASCLVRLALQLKKLPILNGIWKFTTDVGERELSRRIRR